MSDSKSCRDCGQTLPLDSFPRNRSRRDGYGAYCKACYSLRYRRYREKKAAQAGRTIRERDALPPGMKYCPRCDRTLALILFGSNRSTSDGLTAYCKSCHNAAGRESRGRNGGAREYHLRRRYGIGQADVDAMLAEQGGVCAACRVDKPQHVDHDHETGEVRGMLCFLCSQALGNVRDDINRLHGLVRYLRASRRAAPVLVVEEYDCRGYAIEIDSGGFHAA